MSKSHVYTCVVAKVVTRLLKCNYNLVAILATIKGVLLRGVLREKLNYNKALGRYMYKEIKVKPAIGM